MSYKQDENYIEVSERILKFYEEYPQGRLVCNENPLGMRFGEQDFVAVHARAFRTPDDAHPGDGWAWEPVPGTTPFTRNSELMNAQTAAIGRAIVSVGLLASRSIASAEEVRNRKAEDLAVEATDSVRKKKKTGGLPAKDVKALESAIRSWLEDHPDKRDDFKMKVVALGVLDPNGKLSEVLAQIPDKDSADKLRLWLNENDKE